MLHHALQYKPGEGAQQITLAEYVSAGASRCCVRLMREGCTASAPQAERLLPVSLATTLREALAGQLVIEFPRFSVALCSDSGEPSGA